MDTFQKIIQFSLMALIAGFFAIILAGLCLHCKIYPQKPIASVLLLFFR